MRTADRRVVTPLQLRLIEIVARANEAYAAPNLRLEGGTALAAYHLQHRESEDLDFFADPGINAREFGQVVRELAAREGIVIETAGPASLGYARLLAHSATGVNAVRLDIAAASPFQLESPEPTAEGISVASYRDLCAGKLHAICDRFAERDFIDLHVILHRLEEITPADEPRVRARARALVHDVIAIDPGLTPHLVGQAISRGLDRPLVGSLPLRLLIPIGEEEVQTTLRLCIEECARLTLKALDRSRREAPDSPPPPDVSLPEGDDGAE